MEVGGERQAGLIISPAKLLEPSERILFIVRTNPDCEHKRRVIRRVVSKEGTDEE